MGVKVRQKVKGKGQPWWVFVSHNNRRTSRKIGSKRAADVVAATIEAKLALGEFDFEDEKTVPVFKVYSDSWIKNTVPATCKESTQRDYGDILDNHVLPVFKNTEITKITRGKVKDFLLSKLNDGYSPNTVCHFKDVISGVLTKALDDEIINANPALMLKMKNALRKKDSIAYVNALYAKELKILLDCVQKHYNDHYVLFLLLARTGVRVGEALALEWGDIDFNSRFIEVKRSIVRGKISTPKTENQGAWI